MLLLLLVALKRGGGVLPYPLLALSLPWYHPLALAGCGGGVSSAVERDATTSSIGLRLLLRDLWWCLWRLWLWW